MSKKDCLYNNLNRNFICKICEKTWFGEKGERPFHIHTESESHKKNLKILQKSCSNEEINNKWCYIEYDFNGINRCGGTCRIGFLKEEENDSLL